MGKSLVIKGADFSVNGIKTYVWNIDFTGSLSSFTSAAGSFTIDTGISYLPSLFGNQQTIRCIQLGTACPDTGNDLPSAIKVFKINRSTLMATFLTQADYTIPSKESTEKMVIDLGEEVTLGSDETLAFYGVLQDGSTQNGASFIGITIDDNLPANTLAYCKSNNLDYSSSSFAITLNNLNFKAELNIKLGI